MKLAPKVARSYYHFLLSKRFERTTLVCGRWRNWRSRIHPGYDERIYAHFALGKALADIEDYERSFRHLSQGNALKRKQSGYDEAEFSAIWNACGRLARANSWVAITAAAILPRFPYSSSACRAPAPVWSSKSWRAIAMSTAPGRSKISTWHWRIRAAAGSALYRPEIVSQMSGEEFRRLGTNYLQQIQVAAPSARRIVNKMTGEFPLRRSDRPCAAQRPHHSRPTRSHRYVRLLFLDPVYREPCPTPMTLRNSAAITAPMRR